MYIDVQTTITVELSQQDFKEAYEGAISRYLAEYAYFQKNFGGNYMNKQDFLFNHMEYELRDRIEERTTGYDIMFDTMYLATKIKKFIKEKEQE